jgi:hypothetical protein
MNLLKFIFIYLLGLSAALASPGAHGPNGEHLDAPAGGARVHGNTGPRIDTFTESFELVGRLQDGELSILIDRYETNEPVLNGKLEAEVDGLKASATFHADHGDYAIADEAFLKAISKPGKHALLFTLTAGAETDLLEGTLEVRPESQHAAHAEPHGVSLTHRTWAIGGIVIFIAFAALVMSLRRRKNQPGK